MILTHLMLFGFFDTTTSTLSYSRVSRGLAVGVNRGAL